MREPFSVPFCLVDRSLIASLKNRSPARCDPCAQAHCAGGDGRSRYHAVFSERDAALADFPLGDLEQLALQKW
ncbi:MAG: hypothetical protein ABI831_23095, partial [Betaproteobacteria bacterium]